MKPNSLVMVAAAVLVGCSKDTPETSQAAEAEAQVASKPTPEPDPVSPADEKLIADPIVERAVRRELKKPEGKLTEADLESVRSLDLSDTKSPTRASKRWPSCSSLPVLN